MNVATPTILLGFVFSVALLISTPKAVAPKQSILALLFVALLPTRSGRPQVGSTKTLILHDPQLLFCFVLLSQLVQSLLPLLSLLSLLLLLLLLLFLLLRFILQATLVGSSLKLLGWRFLPIWCSLNHQS
jgi:hypothetical protein